MQGAKLLFEYMYIIYTASFGGPNIQILTVNMCHNACINYVFDYAFDFYKTN